MDWDCTADSLRDTLVHVRELTRKESTGRAKSMHPPSNLLGVAEQSIRSKDGTVIIKRLGI